MFLEVPSSALAGFKVPHRGIAGVLVTGSPTDAALRLLARQIDTPGARVAAIDERGKWPHIRTNWVTRNNDVLVVTNRSSQPWIENNAALLRIARAAHPDRPATISYPWKPITVADADRGPSLENYLVAIAEAGSFGGDLVLPLHASLQQGLAQGDPLSRRDWQAIRRHLEFYAWDLPGSHTPIASVAVVTAQPDQHFEVMNLLLRHNVPFEVMAPAALSKQPPDRFGLVIVLDALGAGDAPWRSGRADSKTDDQVTYAFGKGKVVERLKPIADPNAFALEARRLLGRDHRAIEIWNGITVLAAPYQHPDGSSMLVTALNYAHQPLPVQLRVRGTFAVVHYESPDEPLTLLPYQHRGGYTEFTLPALRIGARIFLSERLPDR